jgi:hypothetical protein
MVLRRVLCSAASTVLALGLATALPLTASAQATVAFTISDSRITESSGLATDPQARAYWTVNDSGADGVVYALNPSGKVIGTLQYRAKPLDAEAVALRKGRLYVADIGDNTADRNSVTVYYFDNAQAVDQTVGYHSWDFSYPDGPHDAETLLVNDAGRLFVVTKDAEGAIYAAPGEPKRDGTNALVKVGNAPAAVTDGTFLPGGRRIALLTYGAIEIIDANTYKRIEELNMPVQPQPESLTVSLDNSSLLVGSEGNRSKVYSLPIPKDQSATPKPSATQSSGTDDPGSDASDEPTDADSTSGRSRAGTFMALGLAGIVAGVAGAVVGLVRKP